MRRIRRFYRTARKTLRNRRLFSLMILMMMVTLISPAVIPAHAESFSVTTTGLLDSAAQIFNGLWPVFAIIAGLGLGIALVKFIVRAVQSAFGG